MIYLIIIVILVFLSIHYDINGKTKNKKFWYYIVLLTFILLAGLRYRIGIDTPNYIRKFYYRTDYLWDLSVDNFSLGSDPLFMLLNSFVYSLGGRFFIVQLIHAIIVNSLILHYVKKHSPYIFTFSVLYFIAFYYGVTDVMRASLSIAVCLYANDYILRKSWVKGISLYFIGCLFHIQTLLILFTPFLFFIRLNKKLILLFAFGFFIGLLAQSFLERNMDFFLAYDALSGKMNSHINGGEDMFGSRLNIFGIIPRSIPALFAFFSLYIIKKSSVDKYLLKFEPLVLIGVLFYLVSIHAFLMYRYVDYYCVYFLIFFSHTIINIIKLNYKGICRIYTITASLFILAFLVNAIKEMVPIYRTFYPYSSVIEKSVDRERERVLQYTYDRDSYKKNEF